MKNGARIFILAALLVGVLAASYFFYFAKLDVKRRMLQAKTDERLKSLGDLERAKAEVRDVDRKLADLQQATAFFESKLPQARDMDKVLPEVWKLAEQNNLTTKTVKPAKSQRMTGYSEQSIEMSLSGNFKGFYQFMLQLENLPRLTRVTQMNLTKINDRDGEMQASLTLSIFFEPESAGTATASAQ